MTADEIRDRLASAGRSIQWLADQAGYHRATLYNALSRKRFPRRMENEIRRVFDSLDTQASSAGNLSKDEIAEISRIALAQGFKDADAWIAYHARIALGVAKDSVKGA